MAEHLTATEAAKRARADIHAAVKDGALGTYPAGIRIGVRTTYASQMSAICVTIRNAPPEWAFRNPGDARGTRRISREAVELGGRLRGIVARHYTENGRHRFIDVRVKGTDTDGTEFSPDVPRHA